MENKNTLINLITDSSEIVNEIIANGGELTLELEQSLEQSNIDLALKLDNYAYLWERLEVEATYWKAKADEFARVAKSVKTVNANLKSRLKFALVESKKSEMVGNDFKFKLAKTSGKLVVEDQSLIPKEFITTTIVESVDNAKLKEALKSGQEIEGASLVMTPSLRKYAAKRVK